MQFRAISFPRASQQLYGVLGVGDMGVISVKAYLSNCRQDESFSDHYDARWKMLAKILA